ncbi:MAG: hypothetical protein HY786_02230 [Deltaproteobacteria bacterium]|nr:hypothetical protein [Deltaproteobacteria bacterium]
METISRSLESMENPARRLQTEERLERIKKGERDIFFCLQEAPFFFLLPFPYMRMP